MNVALITIVLLVVGLFAMALAFEWMVAKKAPVGYQDETGFHYGPSGQNSKKDLGSQPLRSS